MDITERMGVLPRVEAAATGTTRMTVHREGSRRPTRVDLAKVFQATSDRHVEVMRDDLSEIYYDAAREDVEYLFGDSITALSPDGEVTFEHAPPRRFDVVVGADGLHSNVRRLVFGEEGALTTFSCPCPTPSASTAKPSPTSAPAGPRRSTAPGT